MRRFRTCVLFLTVLSTTCSPLTAVERSVLCQLHSSCRLLCPFNRGPEVVIHWLHPPDASSSVHSYYYNKDQLKNQLPRYRNRTKQFLEQIPKGNASLQLSGVQLEDRGRYKCYTSTTYGINEDIITVKVQAPVSKVSMTEDGSVVKCVSSDVFPKPSVTWTPPSDRRPIVTSSQSGLFSVISSVNITQSNTEHSCNISTEHSWRSATYRRTGGVTWSRPRTTVPCAETNEPVRSLVWTFNRSQDIFTRTKSSTSYNPDWESRVEKDQGSGLVLKDLTRDQQGVYSCVLVTDRSTYLTVTEVTVVESQSSGRTALITGIVLPVVLLLLLVAVGFFCRRRRMEKWRGLNSKKMSEKKIESYEVKENLNPPETTSDTIHDSSQFDGDQPP